MMNTLGAGQSFGGNALLYNCARTATVVAKELAGVGGVQSLIFLNFCASRPSIAVNSRNTFPHQFCVSAFKSKADGHTFKDVLREFVRQNADENQKLKDSLSIFAGLSAKQKHLLNDSLFLEKFAPGVRGSLWVRLLLPSSSSNLARSACCPTLPSVPSRKVMLAVFALPFSPAHT